MAIRIMVRTIPNGKGAVSPITTTFKERLVPEDDHIDHYDHDDDHVHQIIIMLITMIMVINDH